MSPSNKASAGQANILLLMAGSIACAKASGLISAWVKQGHEVQVACTRSVANFIGHATLEGLSGHPVLGDAFAPGQVMDHIHLARWADIIVAAPATSNLVNKLAAGIADDAVTSLWQAAYGQNKPMFIVPAMNTRMWAYPATQDSVHRLQSWGIRVLPTAEGDLACGDFGAGRMLEPENIMEQIGAVIPGTSGKRVLITAGGTREPIDSVRYIGNISTGRTAAALAGELNRRGHQVTWLGAAQAERPHTVNAMEAYVTFEDLHRQLQRLLGEQKFDAVIHAAAVSDYAVDRIEVNGACNAVGEGKLPSTDGMSLHLKPNPKLLGQLRGWSANPAIQVIAFKLTHAADRQQRTQAINHLLAGAGADAVVHNDLAEMQGGQHPFSLHTSDRESQACADVAELARRIDQLLEGLA